MARIRKTATPDSGYKFDCQECGMEIVQGSQPDLVIITEETVSGKNRSFESVCIQACEECAGELKEEEKERIRQRGKKAVSQVRALRPGSELASILPAPVVSPLESKLDKLIELMTLQIQATMATQVQAPRLGAVSRSEFIEKMEETLTISSKRKPAPKPTPKRAILKPPPAKKTNASKTTKRATSTKANAPTKQKPRSRR